MSEFNLLEEKWLKVLDGTEVKEVTLYDLFENAHNYNALAGELPTQDFAVLRFLLAVMYGSFYKNIKEPDDAYDLWNDMFKVKKFDVEKIKNYLEPFKHRFYLFDDEFPFYQMSEDGAEKVSVSNINGEIADSGKPRIFSTISGKRKNEMTKPEAARWLINVLSYDVGSKGRASKTKYHYNGLPWTAQLGGVYIEGENLFETLMKNFVTCKDGNAWNLGTAPWEETNKQRLNTTGHKINKPRDPITLLTLQSRKIKLVLGENNLVNEVYVMGGDYFEDKEDVLCEQMTIWSEKNENKKVIFPKTHDYEKSLWRGLESLISGEGKKTLPGVVYWIKCLSSEKIIPNIPIKISAVGMSYKTTNSAINEFFSDNIKFNPCILTMEILDNNGKRESWSKRLCDEISNTDKVVIAYGRLAENLFLAAGGDYEKKSDAKKREMSRAYYALEMEFRYWLENISSEDDIETKTSEWFEQSIKIVRKVKEDFINRSNIQIFKERKTKNKTYNVYVEIEEFEKSINKIRKVRRGG
jgi:CRISPR system Cascade subunit CasA